MDLTKRSSYNYHLPKEYIAQHPKLKRDKCLLLHLDKNSGQIEHKKFTELVSLLKPDDILVINTTKVIPARLIGNKSTGAKIEVLLLREKEMSFSNNERLKDDKSSNPYLWECLVKPANRLKVGDKVSFFDKFDDEILEGEVVSFGKEGIRNISFSLINGGSNTSDSFLSAIEKIGKVPLPPYIKRDYSAPSELNESREDKDYYQTVYADSLGSAAAPTAGMHFTPEMLELIAVKGIKIVPVVLHIGIDTFRPIKVENILEHKMHREYCTISEESASIINKGLKDKNRIIAVGTTVVRTLESFAVKSNNCNNNEAGSCEPNYLLKAGSKWSELFIYTGYEFKIVDGLLTNFHLPESSLLVLVSAFGGYEKMMAAYQEAVKKQYRFFSYGDAMMII